MELDKMTEEDKRLWKKAWKILKEKEKDTNGGEKQQ